MMLVMGLRIAVALPLSADWAVRSALVHRDWTALLSALDRLSLSLPEAFMILSPVGPPKLLLPAEN
jgi:hypothetical protein